MLRIFLQLRIPAAPMRGYRAECSGGTKSQLSTLTITLSLLDACLRGARWRENRSGSKLVTASL